MISKSLSSSRALSGMCSLEGEKPSEDKPIEKPSGKKQNAQPHPKPIRFHCGYCGRDGHID
jgi:hypothetical protein